MSEQSFPCPSCGFLVFGGPPGTYEVCGVCEWEDDPVQLRHPAMRGGANELSLVLHQQRALLTVPQNVQLARGYVRAKKWRPLHPEEAVSHNAPTDGLSYFEASAEEQTPYYWSRNEAL